LEDDWKSNRNTFWTLATPGTIWLFLFFLIPLGFLLVLSFSDKAVINGQTSVLEYDYLTGISNYLRAFARDYMWIFLRSIVWSAVATFICLVLAYPIAFGICFAPAKWKPFLLLLIILPFWINLLIRTYALIAVFRTQGLVNNVLSVAGIGPFEMLYNSFAVIFGLVYVYMPFMVLPLYATIERLDRSFLEASLDLGATQSTTFWNVTLPLTMPGVITGVILVFIPCLGTFLTSDLLGGPDSWMIGNVIQNQFGPANDWPFGSALSFLLMYATFAVLAARAWFQRRSKGVDA
jgi:spermidine/putrescine transport system permease protein